MSMALFPWLLIVALVWFYLQYYLIVTSEEEYLRGRFGDEYATYCRHVRRFLPRLTSYRSGAPPAKQMDPAEGLSSERRTLQAIGLVTLTIFILFIVRNW
jgi:hypothetical protein